MPVCLLTADRREAVSAKFQGEMDFQVRRISWSRRTGSPSYSGSTLIRNDPRHPRKRNPERAIHSAARLRGTACRGSERRNTEAWWLSEFRIDFDEPPPGVIPGRLVLRREFVNLF